MIVSSDHQLYLLQPYYTETDACPASRDKTNTGTSKEIAPAPCGTSAAKAKRRGSGDDDVGAHFLAMRLRAAVRVRPVAVSFRSLQRRESPGTQAAFVRVVKRPKGCALDENRAKIKLLVRVSG